MNGPLTPRTRSPSACVLAHRPPFDTSGRTVSLNRWPKCLSAPRYSPGYTEGAYGFNQTGHEAPEPSTFVLSRPHRSS